MKNDVIGIYDTNGNKVTEYAYDAYGNCTILNTTNTTIANANPFRYRGYYYDSETGFYYLNSRYYSPEWRRFISPDDTAYLDTETPNGLNLYAYCNNDPVNYADPSGHSVIAAILIGLGIGVAAGLGYAAYTDYQDDYDINGSIGLDYLWWGIIGGALGAGIGFGIGYWGPAIAASVGSAISSVFIFGAGNALALAGGGTSSVAGAQILTSLGAIGIIIHSVMIGKSGGYKVKHYYPNDHDPTHVHIYGDDIADKLHGIRVGLDMNPLKGQPDLPPGAKKALKKLWKIILEALANR